MPQQQPSRNWRDIAAEAQKEKDSQKFKALIQELNQAVERRNGGTKQSSQNDGARGAQVHS